MSLKIAALLREIKTEIVRETEENSQTCVRREEWE